MSGWPDPEKPGVPLNPKVTGEHYIGDSVALWYSDSRKWALIRGSRLRPADWVAGQCWAKYIGPCPTSDEANALRAENARLRDALEETCHALEAATAFHYAKGGFPFKSSKQTLKQARAALEVKP